jgi:hypothetical protein
MDADWSVEIGEGLPWIDVPWQGWIDLSDPSTAAAKLRALDEVKAYPELVEVLLDINSNHTAALSSKCDVFPIDIDDAPLPAMMDQGEPEHDQEVRCGLGSYIDIIFAVEQIHVNFAWCESLVRRVATELLAPIPMPRASVEIVIRQGCLHSTPGYGLTIYAMGFGRDAAAARAVWSQAMRFSASITMLEIASQVMAIPKRDHVE